jgi:hypothetical protein
MKTGVLQTLGALKEATGAGINPDVNTLAAATRTFGEEQQLQHAFDAIQLAGAEPGLQLRSTLDRRLWQERTVAGSSAHLQ